MFNKKCMKMLFKHNKKHLKMLFVFNNLIKSTLSK
jgi:hypothetical protein